MTCPKKLYYSLLLVFFSFSGQAQKWVIDSETGTMVGAARVVPYGLQMNQWGEIPSEGPFVFQRFRLRDSLRTIHTSRPSWKYQYGASVALNVGLAPSIRLSSAYVGVRSSVFGLRLGRWQEVQGIVDSTYSSGSFTWSGNALPLPRVEAGIPNFTPVFGSSLFAVKGFLAHGWFDQGRVVNSYLHQKSAYLRVGKPQWKLKMYTGFNHQVQWGGRPSEPFVDRGTGELITQFPTGWRTWVNVATGVSLNRDGAGLNQPGVPSNEALNRAGNHLGGVDVALQLDLQKGRLLLYKQSFFEDGSLFYLTNIEDGLYGVSYRTKESNFLKHLTAEFLYTLSQGGPGGSTNNAPQLRGQDNYFNNSLYVDGWTYGGRTIGHPFMMPKAALNPDLTERYPGGLNILSNRVTGINIQASYTLNAWHLASQVYHIRSLGTYNFRFTESSLGIVQTVRKQIGYRGGSIRFRGALETGNLLRPSVGLEFSYLHPITFY